MTNQMEAQYGLFVHNSSVQMYTLAAAIVGGVAGYLVSSGSYAVSAFGAVGAGVGYAGYETHYELNDIREREADFSAHPPLSGPRSLATINEKYAYDPKND
jgi:hypothetical protein